MPQDIFFKPPGYERELGSARDAARQLAKFLGQFPGSKHAPKAQERLRFVRRRLADHEFYVATFYLERERPRAAALRLTGLLRNYTGLGLDAQALFLLSRAYLELGDVNKAVRPLYDLVKYHPNHPLGQKASAYLRRHGFGQAPPAGK